MGFLVHHGWRALSALVVGQLAVWLGWSSNWYDYLALSMTMLAIMAAWGVSLLVNFIEKKKNGRELDMPVLVLSHLGIPILAMLPYAFARAWLFVGLGTIPESEFGPMLLHTLVNSVLAMLVFGSLTLHFLRGDFLLLDLRGDARGVFAGMLALGVMTMAFMGNFNHLLSSYLAVFLPFPLLVVTAVWLAPASSSVFVALWCLLSVMLSCLGYGPFLVPVGPHAMNGTIELGLYIIVIASVVYSLSLGSSRLSRLLNLNEVALSAAGIEPWEWDFRRGFSSFHGQPTIGYLQTVTAGLEGHAALRRLEGTESESTEIQDAWRATMVKSPAADAVYGSAGRILRRDGDHQPTHAIGLLQDLTAERKATAALVELGQRNAQIRNMQVKLNPHFLFNSLNVIRALVHIDKAKADGAIHSLSELLRSNLRTSDALFARLEDELKPVQAFVELAQLRFGHRLKARIQVPPKLYDISIPPMLLLNLVENAVTHGIGNLEKGGSIEIEASDRAGQVRISVRNTGTLGQNFEQGIGTQDAKQRLELLFGDQACFILSQMDASTVAAEIVLPICHSLSKTIHPTHSSLS